MRIPPPVPKRPPMTPAEKESRTVMKNDENFFDGNEFM
jgi:hypothetical protein